jgi:hypothetical protein
MKAFLAAVVAIAGLSYGADYALNNVVPGFSAADKAAVEGVRLPESTGRGAQNG